MKKFKKLTLTLVALFAMTTGAWAAELTIYTTAVDMTSLKVGDILAEGFRLTSTNQTGAIFNIDAGRGKKDESISQYGYGIDTKNITSYGANATFTTDDGTYYPIDENSNVGNAWVVTQECTQFQGKDFIKIAGVTIEPPLTVTWDAATNQATFLMPVSDVELQVEYYPAMLSLGGDAIEGGTVEVVGLTDDALPAGFEKDAEGNIYVAEGTTFTVKAVPDEDYHLVCWSDDENNIHPEREITMGVQDLAFTAIFAENEYDITFSVGTNPDPENPEWTATPNTGVKKGQTVTVTYTGSKKVIGVKAAGPPALNLTSPAVGQVIGSDGLNYADAAAATSAGVTAVARICYVSGEHGLALALADETGKMNWSTAMTTAAAHTPKFTNGTWQLASKDEWTNMINAAGSKDALRDGFTSVGGTNLVSDYYWSSTQGETDPAGAWRYCFNYGGYWNRDMKFNATTWVRACLAW